MTMLNTQKQLNIAEAPPSFRLAQFFRYRVKSPDTALLMESIFVTLGAITVIVVFRANSVFTDAWFASPAVLLIAALAPTIIRKRKLSDIGFNARQPGLALLMVCKSSAVLLPALFCGLWLLKTRGLNLPLKPVLAREQNLFAWMFYQFMYVAVAEEVFFRGYLQSNIMRFVKAVKGERRILEQLIVIVVSAAIFAVAHIIVQGRLIAGLTFVPGLIFAWLFMRTRSLLAPILLHGLANVCYFLMATAIL